MSRMSKHSGCERRDALMEETQRQLLRLADLARAQGEALRNNQENVVMAIDKEVERTLGEKERSLGALREHKKEHGC